jgi:hypothetical protein
MGNDDRVFGHYALDESLVVILPHVTECGRCCRPSLADDLPFQAAPSGALDRTYGEGRRGVPFVCDDREHSGG